jgi:hypothetical protein
MIASSFEAATLDNDTLMLVWLAALVAIDAPSESFLMNLGAASNSHVKREQVHAVLEALAHRRSAACGLGHRQDHCVTQGLT